MRTTISLWVAMAAIVIAGCDAAAPESSALSTSGPEAGVSPDNVRAGARFVITMDGESEAPGPGDEDGTGTARLTFNIGLQRVCYDVMVEDIETPTAAHVHIAPVGVAGPVVIPLDVSAGPTPTHFSGCVNDVERSLIRAIMVDPAEYYVNVHNAPFPGGAVRGQLGRGRKG